MPYDEEDSIDDLFGDDLMLGIGEDETGDIDGYTIGTDDVMSDIDADGDDSAVPNNDTANTSTDDDGNEEKSSPMDITMEDLLSANDAAQQAHDDEELVREYGKDAQASVKKKRKRRKKKTMTQPLQDDDNDTKNTAIQEQTAAVVPSESVNDGAIEQQGSEPVTSDTLPEGTEAVQIPSWATSIMSKRDASVAHAFMLSGNIRDYMVRQISIRDGIIGMFDPMQENFDVIATYNQADGLRFDLGDRYTKVSYDEYRERFIALMHEAHYDSDEIPTDPCELFGAIARIFDMGVKSGERSKMLLFVDFTELLVPDGASLQLRDSDKRLAIIMSDMCRSYKADKGGSCVVFLTDAKGQVNSMLRDTASRVDQTNVPQPTLDERRDFINNVLDVPRNTLSDGRQVFDCVDGGGIDADYLAINTAGLACYQIEDIVLRSIADDEPITAQNVKDRKNEIIKNDYNDVLEIMDPTFGFDGLGGMKIQKKFFKEEVIDPVHSGDLSAVPLGVLMSGPAGTGKCLPHLTFIPTPFGWKRAGQIRVNDTIFDKDGHPTRILGVFPQGELDVYRVTLRDGRTVDCSADHLWHVGRKCHGRMKWENLTVAEMLNQGVLVPASRRHPNKKNTARFFVPQSDCVQYPHNDNQEMSPYALGCFLGDGCVHKNDSLELSSADEFIVKTVSTMLHAIGYKKHISNHSWNFYSLMPQNGKNGTQIKSSSYPQLQKLLTQTYAKDKHIPAEYLIADREQRLELLRGLMDTDGSIQYSGGRYNVSFNTTSKQLAEDVASLVYSLGWSAHIKKDNRAGNEIVGSKERYGKTHYRQNDNYDVALLLPNKDKHLVFKLPRKHDIAMQAIDKESPRHHDRIAIESIKKLGYKEEMVCFYVDNPLHLFLVGEYVPTHNTVLAKAVAKESNMNCVALNMNNIFDKYVGQSERNLDRALDCAMAMSPTIIFIDEIDEALPKRHTGELSGLNNRINKTMLTFLSDTSHRGKVIVLAASNFPDQIDPAMKRAGRFDKRIPIFAPNGFDRVRIIKISAKKATSVNVNGDVVPYEMSCLQDPDKLITNPFPNIAGWLANGHEPENPQYVGDNIGYEYEVKDHYGSLVTKKTHLPKSIYNIIGKRKITLSQFYRAIDGLIEMPKRIVNTVQLDSEDDKSFYERIGQKIDEHAELFGNNAKVMNNVKTMMIYYDRKYKPFMEQTDHMTGAELDVVVQKAITLFRKWKVENADTYAELLRRGILKSEKDIPWPVVFEACNKTTNSTASVKSMEDNALLDTSDLDFVPDAIYTRTNDGTEITYRQRLEELRLRADQANN